MAEIKVFAANPLPKIKRPRKNNPHVSMVMTRSTVINSTGIIASMTIAMPDIPPATKLNGNKKTAVPNASIRVPTTTKRILRIWTHASFLVNFIVPPK